MINNWSRATRTIALVTLILGLLVIAYLGRDMVRPLILSVLLAYVLNPLITLVAGRSRLLRGLAVALLLVFVLVGLSALVATLAPIIAEQAQLLALEFEVVTGTIVAAFDRGIFIFGYELPLESLLLSSTALLPEQLLQSDLILGVLGGAASNLIWIIFILVTTYYLLQDWDSLRDWLLKLPPERLQPDAQRLYRRIKAVWQGYLRGQLLLSTIIALLTGISMTAIGLPAAGLIGILTGALDFIPPIGPVIAMVIAAVVAWASGSTYLAISNAWVTLIVVGLFAIILALENVWLRPAIMGRSVRMHPAVVFVAIIGAFTVAGIIGGLVVVPAIATLGILGHYIRCRILGLDPWGEGSGNQLPNPISSQAVVVETAETSQRIETSEVTNEYVGKSLPDG